MAHRIASVPRSIGLLALLGVAALLAALAPATPAAAAQPARLRIVNQIEGFDYFFCFDEPQESDTCKDFYVNGVKVASLDYRYSTPYLELPAGNALIQMVPYGKTPAEGVIAQIKTYVEAGKSYSAVVRGWRDPGFTIIWDRIPTIDSSQVAIKFANFATELPGIDVYIDGQRVLRNLTYRAHSSYFRIPAGTHLIEIARTGSSERKAVIQDDFQLAAGSVSTAFVSGFLESERVAFGAHIAADR